MKKKRKDADRPQEVKIVWDVTLGDATLFGDRMGLIQHAAEVIRKKGMTPKFAVVIHGPATKFVARSLSETNFKDEKSEGFAVIHKVMKEMSEDNTRFIQCQVPMIRNNVSEDNLLPFIEVSETIFFDLATLQMKGYAYIPIAEL